MDAKYCTIVQLNQWLARRCGILLGLGQAMCEEIAGPIPLSSKILPMSRPLSLLPLVALTAGAMACHPSGVATPPTGQEVFAGCTPCHGFMGEGKVELQAPRIAGLPAWYVKAQLQKFKTGARAYHPDDVEGLRMRPMTRQLMTEGDLLTVSEHVARLKAPPSAPVVKGAGQDGATAYAACVGCHGARGEGMEVLNAPPLAGQSDWYLVAQLKKFKAGLRGTHPADTSGASMRPMAMSLPDEQAMKNVAAHIATLSGAAP